MDEQRSTPICGDCGFFRPDAQRTGSYRLGWCAKRCERHDRCDLIPECSEDRPIDAKPTRTEIRSNNRHKGKGGMRCHMRKILCVTTGTVYQSITAAAQAVGMKPGTLSDALLRSHGGQTERKGKVFRYMD